MDYSIFFRQERNQEYKEPILEDKTLLNEKMNYYFQFDAVMQSGLIYGVSIDKLQKLNE